LVHRYSFNESSGKICQDSVGGSECNGTLPSGGTFGAGRLALSSVHSQYVRLPSGILSNYTAVTIDAWVNFPTQLPENCFFFGFGDSRGDMGENYIFCAPRAGRVAISDGNYAHEKNAYGNSDFSFKSNLHLTAVFNPPQGCIALYTNGVLAGINYGANTPISSVRDIYNYIGRSLYAVDPYADLSLDEFRIYNGALSDREIMEIQTLGPDKLPITKQSFSQR
jgi:hypothetical protein